MCRCKRGLKFWFDRHKGPVPSGGSRRAMMSFGEQRAQTKAIVTARLWLYSFISIRPALDSAGPDIVQSRF